MQQIIAWFGWGNGIGALLGISAILTAMVILTPVVAGYLLYALERFQLIILKKINVRFAYFFVNYATFPGTFIHEMSHLCFGVITGAKVREICIFESDNGRIGHIRYINRGPWFITAVQDALIAVAPTIIGFVLGYFLLSKIFSGHYSIGALIGLWYLVISLINHSTMSSVDLKIYFSGVWIFIVPLLVFFLTLGLLA